MEGLFKMVFDYGRSGSLEGVFVADVDDVKYLTDNRVIIYFGEVLGKHSEVYGPTNEDEVKLITTESNVIDIIEKYGLESGYNPLQQPLAEFDMNEDDLPENGIDWYNVTVQEYIDFMRKGKVPKDYLESYRKEKEAER